MGHKPTGRLRQRLRDITAWRLRHVSDDKLLLAMSITAGIIIGAAAWLLKRSVGAISLTITRHFRDSDANWWLLGIPLAGILLTYCFTRFILRADIEHGVGIMMRNLKQGVSVMKRRLMVGSLIASSLTLGFGGSAGGEGPIAFTGAAIGSNMARWLRVSPATIRLMIGIGSAAGIAGIFKAPLGGALFAFEVVGMSMNAVQTVSLILACVLSAMTCHALSGFTLDMAFGNLAPLPYDHLPAVIVLGIFCGLYSLYYSSVCHASDDFYAGIANPWLRCLVSGLVLSVAIFIFPILYGEGYTAMARLLDGNPRVLVADSFFAMPGTTPWTPMLVAIGILLTKGFAKSAATSGGGVAGDFAPSLFAGCITGFLFASGSNLLLGTELPVSIMAFLGMAGVMAGAIEAPLMAMFIVSEMSGAYILFLPITITALTSYSTVWLLNRLRADRLAPTSRGIVLNLDNPGESNSGNKNRT